jgi:hypothetical protein
MSELEIVILLTAALSGLFLWLLVPRKSSKTSGTPMVSPGNDPLPIAKHYAYFPQIRQSLSAEDSEYLAQAAPPQIAKQALRERRAVARRFLEGLREDFSSLASLGRMIAALSPEVSREQETERLVLSLKFQLLYGLVWLRLAAGNIPVQQLETLTGLVGRLAKRMDEAMVEISSLSAGQLRTNQGA